MMIKKISFVLLIVFSIFFSDIGVLEAGKAENDSLTLRSLAEKRQIVIANVLTDSYGWRDPKKEKPPTGSPYLITDSDGAWKDPQLEKLADREFNGGTLDLYWNLISPEARGKYNFEYADDLFARAKKAKQHVIGHTVIYGYEWILPTWLTKGKFTRQEYIQILQEYIRAVMKHFKGRINTWTLVNEYDNVPDGDPDDPYSDFFKRNIGPEYVDISFETARKADPAAILLYNQANNETANGIYTHSTQKLVERLRAKGLIDGVGLQMHLDGSHPPEKQDLIATMRSYKLPIYITELDVDIRHVPGTQAERWAHQAKIYQTVMEAALEVGVKYIGFWGPIDQYNWLELSPPEVAEVSPDADPGLFDDHFRPKPAYTALVNVLKSYTPISRSPQNEAPTVKPTEDSSQFFPIGLLCVDDFYPRSPQDPPSKITVLEEFPEIARAGFNVIRVSRFDFDGITPDGTPPEWGNTDENARVLLDAAQRSGIKVLMGLSYADWSPGRTLSNDQLNFILRRVRALKDHPALFGWVLNDDTPQGGIQPEGQPLEPDPGKLRKIRRAIKAVDPRHPLTIGLPGAVDHNYEYRDIADIYEPDNFPVGFEVIPPDLPQEWEMHLEDVGKFIDQIYKVIGPNQKVIPSIQIYNLANDSLTWGGPPGDPNRMPDNLGRYPTRAEMRFMAYNALIHKSQGVFFNCYRWNYKAYGRDDGEGGDDVSPRENPSQWAAVASVASELKSMAPIFLAPDANKNMAIKPGPAGIEFLLKDYKDKLYLIAANPSKEKKTAVFTLSQPVTAIKVLNEARSITPKGGSFTDLFDAYGVHCYEITGAAGK